MSTLPTTAQQLTEQFLESLRELPDIRAELSREQLPRTIGASQPDLQVILQVGDQLITLQVEVKRAVYPRDVRESIWQLKALSHQIPIGHNSEFQPVLIADAISPGAKELLRSERVGYFDSGGSLYLPARGAYLYIDKPPPKVEAKLFRTLFSGRRAQVIHAMLIYQPDWFNVRQLATQASASTATTSQVLTELDRFGWLEIRGNGPNKQRRLLQPATLLDEWATQNASARAPQADHYFVPNVKSGALLEHIASIFDKDKVEYAISFEAAAQLYAPYLSNISRVRARVLPGPQLAEALDELGAKTVREGANLSIITATSGADILFRNRVKGICLASPIQVYIDLLRSEGRSKEMAMHLRKQRIGF